MFRPCRQSVVLCVKSQRRIKGKRIFWRECRPEDVINGPERQTDHGAGAVKYAYADGTGKRDGKIYIRLPQWSVLIFQKQ